MSSAIQPPPPPTNKLLAFGFDVGGKRRVLLVNTGALNATGVTVAGGAAGATHSFVRGVFFRLELPSIAPFEIVISIEEGLSVKTCLETRRPSKFCCIAWCLLVCQCQSIHGCVRLTIQVDEDHGHGDVLRGQETVAADGKFDVGPFGVSVLSWP